MAENLNKKLLRLRSTRDLRAEVLDVAAQLVDCPSNARVTVADPVINTATIRAEWERLLPAIVPEVRGRMRLVIERDGEPSVTSRYTVESRISLLDRPNYRYEVLRLLLAADFEGDGVQPVKGLVEKIGASQTAIRNALAELRKAGLCRSWGSGFETTAEDISMELLARAGALPQTLRFRFERGARIKSPAALLERALPLLRTTSLSGWDQFALSGTAVAQAEVRSLDLLGTPRLDLIAHVPRSARSFDSQLLRHLDDGLEIEPSVIAPAPVVVTLVRADTPFIRHGIIDQARCATPADAFLSLLDIGLRDQALQYVRAKRP